jgi:hypothetical protein
MLERAVDRGRLALTARSTDVTTKTMYGYGLRCHACDLGIEMRDPTSGPRSKNEG